MTNLLLTRRCPTCIEWPMRLREEIGRDCPTCRGEREVPDTRPGRACWACACEADIIEPAMPGGHYCAECAETLTPADEAKYRRWAATLEDA